MTKWTVGPWKVNAIVNGRIVGDETVPADKLHINAANHTVAVVYRSKDARLIAAAPDMASILESLIPVLADHAQYDEGEESAESVALAKARALLARINGE